MGIAELLKRPFVRWQAKRDRRFLDDRQCEQMARDIGLPKDILDRLMTDGARSNDELHQMMTVLGLDARDIRQGYAAQIRDMSVTCSGCTAVRRCHRELAGGTARTTYRDFCPNTEAFDELQRDVWCDRKERHRHRLHPVAQS